MPVFQPSNQIKLTNVSIVRLKKGGKRFEIACYKNKVREWRTGVETDLSEVIQIEQVFTNVSKGQVASDSDLLIGFPMIFKQNASFSDQNPKPSSSTNNSKSNKKKQQQQQSSSNEANKKKSNNNDHDSNVGLDEIHHKILIEILKNGELQVSEKERQEELNEKRREISNLVAEKTLDPNTNRPHTISMIDKAMESIHFSINLSKSSKSQALEVIKILIDRSDIISICRNQMRIRLSFIKNNASKDEDQDSNPIEKFSKLIESELIPLFYEIESNKKQINQWELIGLIDPSQFKIINQFIQNNSSDESITIKLETLSLSAQQIVRAD